MHMQEKMFSSLQDTFTIILHHGFASDVISSHKHNYIFDIRHSWYFLNIDATQIIKATVVLRLLG